MKDSYTSFWMIVTITSAAVEMHEIGHLLHIGEADDDGPLPFVEVYSGDADDDTPERVSIRNRRYRE